MPKTSTSDLRYPIAALLLAASLASGCGQSGSGSAIVVSTPAAAATPTGAPPPHASSPGTAEAAAPAPRQDPDGRDTLVTLARLEPKTRVINVGASTDDVIAELKVKEGDRVEANAPLAYLRSHALRKAEYQHLTRRLAEAEDQLKTETALGESLVAAARIGARRSRLRSYDLQVSQSEAKMAQAELTYAKSQAGRDRALAGVLSDRDREAAVLDVSRKQAALAQAEARLEQVRERTNVEEQQAENDLRTEQAKLARARSAIPVESLKEELAVSAARLEQTVVRAPQSGQVLKILVSPGERVAGRALLQMGETSEMYAIAEVHQTDVHLVRVGQKVEVSSPALPTALEGKVEDVGVMIFKNSVFGDDPNPASNARVFQVRIKLGASELAARFTNLEVNARIQLGNAPD